jgi:hypothetical protein
MDRAHVLLLVVILSAGLCYGQVTVGRITGRITDQSGAAVPGITVTAVEPATGVRTETTAQENGSYVFTSLRPGNYSLTVEKQGFSTITNTGIVLDAASSRSVDFVLKPATLTDSISVQATAEQVRMDSGDVGSTLDNRKIDQIAMNGRNYFSLLNLLPGVTTSSLDPVAVGVNMTGTSVNGSRNPSAGVYLDGVTNTAVDQNSYQTLVPNPDTIAEIKVLTASYAAEYGGSSGATMTLVSKSGASQFHGSLFEYFRNDALDARSFLSVKKDPRRLNDFGATFGGPIYIPGAFNSSKNKLFFFAAFEKKYYHYASTSVSVVPTALERAGNFQGSKLGTPVDPLNGAPFPSNIIPSTRFSSNGPKLLDPYPLPNSASSAGNFVRNGLNTQDPLKYQAKVDYNANYQMRWSSSFVVSREVNKNDGGALGITPSVKGSGQPGWLWGVNMTYSLSPTLLNYASVGLSHQDLRFEPPSPRLNRTLWGLTYPQLAVDNPYNIRPKMTITGLTAINYANPSKKNTAIELRDDLTKVIGGHILKVGAYVMRARDNEYTTGFGNVGGSLTFNTSAQNSTKVATADALLGNFYLYTQDRSMVFGWSRFTTFDGYAQDSWQVSKKLHLDLGVRYSFAQLPYSPVGNESVFVPSRYDRAKRVSINPQNGAIVIGSGDIYNGLALLGKSWEDHSYSDRIPAVVGDLSRFNSLYAGLPKSIWDSRKANFAPRVGFAYDLFGNGKTAVRGGVGMFYDRPAGNIYLLSMALNPPINYASSVYNGNIDNPVAALSETFPSALTSVGRDFKTPYSLTYNLSVQQQLPANIILDVAYVGSQSRHLARGVNLNQLPVGTLTRPENKGINTNALRPYLGYGNITTYEYADNSNYNSLQAKVSRRLASGLSAGSAFTWAKALDYLPAQGGFTPTTVQDSYDASKDYGPSTVDRKYVFSLNAQYDLPFARKNAIAGGWTISSVFFAQSGAPSNVSVSSDVSGAGTGSSRASLAPNADLHVSERTPARWFNTAAFLPVNQMTQGQFGNAGRNILVGPGFSQLDLSLMKRFRIRENVSLEFRAESFNVFNHTSFTALGTTVGTSTFGSVTATGNPRINQLALKLYF